jgi:hypothetical protein
MKFNPFKLFKKRGLSNRVTLPETRILRRVYLLYLDGREGLVCIEYEGEIKHVGDAVKMVDQGFTERVLCCRYCELIVDDGLGIEACAKEIVERLKKHERSLHGPVGYFAAKIFPLGDAGRYSVVFGMES